MIASTHPATENALSSLLKRWGRRAITLPLCFLVTVMYWVLLPATLSITFAVDLSDSSVQKRPRTRAAAFFAMYLGCQIIGVIAALSIGLITVNGLIVGQQRYIEMNASLQRIWTASIFHGSRWLFSMTVEVEGSHLVESGPFLLFVRHSSVADTMVAAELIANPNKILLKYVLKQELLWDPCLDLVGSRLPNAFVARYSANSDVAIQAVASLTHNLNNKSGVLIYPEGTHFSAVKLERALGGMRRRNMEALIPVAETYRHVLPPRLGGPLALLDAAPDLDIVMLEHAGFEGASSFRSFWRGGLVNQPFKARIRRIPAESIPAQNRDKWLFELWQECDQWIHDTKGTPS